MSSSIKTSWVVLAVALVFATGCGTASLEATDTLSTHLQLEGCTGATNIACADFNGDGQADLAVVDPDARKGNVFLSQGPGMLAAPVSFETGAGSTLSAGDFNADGLVDLKVTNEADGSVSLLVGHGPGGFALPITQAE
jgi:hypothetical protein